MIEKGQEYYDRTNESKFYNLVYKHFPTAKNTYIGGDMTCSLPDNYIEHSFSVITDKILGIFPIRKVAFTIEPDTSEYPRKEIWKDNKWRNIKIHLYITGLENNAVKLAKDYNKFTKKKVKILQEFVRG